MLNLMEVEGLPSYHLPLTFHVSACFINSSTYFCYTYRVLLCYSLKNLLQKAAPFPVTPCSLQGLLDPHKKPHIETALP